MPIVHHSARYNRLFVLVVFLIITSCSISQEPLNRYQIDNGTSRSEVSPVAELHRKALTALEKYDFQQAIDYLQRAITIQPRNAWSWHYLAQSYAREEQFDRCLAMLQRSQSYAVNDNQLARANEKLTSQCQN